MENLSASSLWTTKTNLLQKNKKKKKKDQNRKSTKCIHTEQCVQRTLFMLIQNKEQTNYFTQTVETKFNSEREIQPEYNTIIFHASMCASIFACNLFSVCSSAVFCVPMVLHGSLSYFLCASFVYTLHSLFDLFCVFFLCWFNLPMAYDLLKP